MTLAVALVLILWVVRVTQEFQYQRRVRDRLADLIGDDVPAHHIHDWGHDI